jgi:hypothetical protein
MARSLFRRSVEQRARELRRELRALETLLSSYDAMEASSTPMAADRAVQRLSSLAFGNLSLREVAALAIRTEGCPLATRELVEIMVGWGRAPEGKNPSNNLASILSHDAGFLFVAGRGGGWWLRELGEPPND